MLLFGVDYVFCFSSPLFLTPSKGWLWVRSESEVDDDAATMIMILVEL